MGVYEKCLKLHNRCKNASDLLNIFVNFDRYMVQKLKKNPNIEYEDLPESVAKLCLEEYLKIDGV
jgi:hypothetical protein